MPKFEVISTYTCYVVDTVEAADEDEALGIAEDLAHSAELIGEQANFINVEINNS